MNYTKEQLIAYAIKHEGDYHAIKQALLRHQPYEKVDCSCAITLVDEHYPIELRALEQPPWVIFYQGDITLLQQNKVAVIGSRTPNDYGIIQTRQLVDAIGTKAVIVSGLARGIDRVAHEQAMINSHTIGVLGCGINRVYPFDNYDVYVKMRQKQLIISEYPHHAVPYPSRFVARNRLIAALSNPIFVMAATFKSGTMITVDYGLALDKDIVALPYHNDESVGAGCNLLIASGAHILTNPKDLFIIDRS
jgi:DNA processing protein